MIFILKKLKGTTALSILVQHEDDLDFKNFLPHVHVVQRPMSYASAEEITVSMIQPWFCMLTCCPAYIYIFCNKQMHSDTHLTNRNVSKCQFRVEACSLTSGEYDL